MQDHTGISNVAPADASLRVLPFPKGERYSELQADNTVAEAKIHDFINGLKFCISPTAFFQVRLLLISLCPKLILFFSFLSLSEVASL